jgi:hypothetical protein
MLACMPPVLDAQECARFARLGSESIERAIELEQVHGDLLHFGLLRLVGTVRRRDEQAQHQRGDGRDQSHDELHDVPGVAFPGMLRQAPVQVETKKPAREGAG